MSPERDESPSHRTALFGFERHRALVIASLLTYGLAALVILLMGEYFGIGILADRFLRQVAWIVLILAIVGVFYFGLRPLMESSYPSSEQDSRFNVPADLVEIRQKLKSIEMSTRDDVIAEKIRETADDIRRKVEDSIHKSEDFSDPERIFRASRHRLLSESARIDKISRRNLYFGIVFSGFALAFLAGPLVAQTLIVEPPGDQSGPDRDVVRWLAQTYLPRFAVGLLLQFVGFFFLRLYVANELDLKLNKNEITNIERKMIGLKAAEDIKDVAARREIIRLLAKTERNFIVKKNEKLVSMETVTEYNDLKSLVEQLVKKIPSGEKGGA